MRNWPGSLIPTPHGDVFVRHDPLHRPPPLHRVSSLGRSGAGLDDLNCSLDAEGERLGAEGERLGAEGERLGAEGERLGAGGAAGGAAAAPALFVHGLGGESLDWTDVVALLADRVGGYALDLPGFGESPPHRRASLDAHADAVADVIRVIGGPVHLIGNSLGGAVVTRVAAEHPELVKTLTLLSPALPDLRPRLWSWQLLVTLIPVVGARIVEVALRGDPERMASRVLWLCYGDPSAVADERRFDVVAAARRRAELAHSGAVYRSSLRSLVRAHLQFGRRRLWRQAERVRVPTLLMYGGRDKLVDPRLAKRAAATFPDAQTVLLLEAGHVAQLEFPDLVAGTIRDFLDGALSRGMGHPRGTVVTSDAPGTRRVG